MSDVQVINTLEELIKFLNKEGLLEIAQRGRNKQFKEFVKVAIKNLPESQENELMKNVIHSLNENIKLNELNLLRLGNIAKLQNIGLLLNGLNLCTNCIGFAIMYAKLDKISSEISTQIREVQKTIKDGHELWTDYEFKKVLSDHMDMLDSQKRQNPYSEAKMRELIDKEYNVLGLLINAFQKDVSGNKGPLIYSISSLLSMFTASLCAFDEIYYFNNHKDLDDKDVWHMSHSIWMSIYDVLSSKSFIEKLQDYATFEAGLTTVGVDVYYLEILKQVSDLKEEIEDNQKIILATGDLNLYQQYKKLSEKDINDSIREAFVNAGSGMNESDVMNAFQDAMKAAAMA